MNDGKHRRFESLRRLAMSFQRTAAAGIVGGAVQGASDELQSELPEVDVRELLQESLTHLADLLEKLAEAAESPSEDLASLADLVTRATVRGSVAELRTAMPDLAVTLNGLVVRMNHWLDRSAEEAHHHGREVRKRLEVLADPAASIRDAAINAVEGVSSQLQKSIPELSPVVSDAALQLGTGFANGIASRREPVIELIGILADRGARSLVHGFVAQVGIEASKTWRAIRRPVLTAAGVVGAVAMATVIGLTRR